MYIHSHQNPSGRTSVRHRRVDQVGISTARAIYQQQSKPNTNASLVETAMATWAVCQPQSAKQKHIWRSCIPPVWFRCISEDIENEAKALLDGTAILTRAVSTASSKAKTYLAQLYINRDQQSESISELYINSNRNLKRRHLWRT